MLTEERDTTKREGKITIYPVKGGVKLFAGGFGALDANGLLVPGADAAGLKGVGRINKSVDTTGIADSAMSCPVEEGCFLFAAAGLGADDAGKIAYMVDDETFDLTGGDHKAYGGVIKEVVSATEIFVEMGLSVRPVPVAAAVAAVATADATAAGAAYDQVVAQSGVTLVNQCKSDLNACIAALKAAGLMAA